MLPITPSNFHFFYDKWTKELNSFSNKDKKDSYAKKIVDKLQTFSNNSENNALGVYIKKWCNNIKSKDINSEIVIKGLNQLEKDDNKLML